MKKKVFAVALSTVIACSMAVSFTACGDDDDKDKDKDQATTYTVTYAKGEIDATITLPTDTTKYKEGDTVTVKGGDFTVENYEFNGWSYNSITYQANDTFKMPASNVTLTATWKAAENQGGEGEEGGEGGEGEEGGSGEQATKFTIKYVKDSSANAPFIEDDEEYEAEHNFEFAELPEAWETETTQYTFYGWQVKDGIYQAGDVSLASAELCEEGSNVIVATAYYIQEFKIQYVVRTMTADYRFVSLVYQDAATYQAGASITLLGDLNVTWKDPTADAETVSDSDGSGENESILSGKTLACWWIGETSGNPDTGIIASVAYSDSHGVITAVAELEAAQGGGEEEEDMATVYFFIDEEASYGDVDNVVDGEEPYLTVMYVAADGSANITIPDINAFELGDYAEGYTFDGWYFWDMSEGEEKEFTEYYAFTEDDIQYGVFVYAKWTPVEE